MADESEGLFDVFSFSHSDSNEYNFRSSTELKNKDRVLLQKVLYYSAKSKGLEHTAIEKLLDLTIKELDYQYTRKEHLDNKSGFLLTLWGYLRFLWLIDKY